MYPPSRLKQKSLYSSISQPSKMIVDFVSEYKGGEIKVADEIKDARWTSKTDVIERVASEPMKYRLEWLLENDNRIRFAAYSKRPFQIISEIMMN
jgi:NADH pyrophosphatase NudC (nudix superfamily)